MTERFRAVAIRFIGEQDGPPERELKQKLVSVLDGLGVDRAYLARVEYDGSAAPNVALCAATDFKNYEQIAQHVGDAFSGDFRQDVHLDVLFVSPEQEQQLRGVCRAFYSRAQRSSE